MRASFIRKNKPANAAGFFICAFPSTPHYIIDTHNHHSFLIHLKQPTQN